MFGKAAVVEALLAASAAVDLQTNLGMLRAFGNVRV
jgi:hypothetical protein